MLTLDYIYHSGFALEADGVTVIIDYYKDSSEHLHNEGIVHDRLLKRSGELYVLATHFHPDHFNPEVLTWKEQRPDVHYIFSKDILKHKRALPGDAVYIKKGERYDDLHLHVEAFGSTDVGSSFLLQLQGHTVFHAGDLNNWHWSDESTPQEIRKAEGDFLAELRYLEAKAPHIDVTLFPVDRRMGSDYMRGAEQYVEHIQTDIFVPMHFSEDYEGGNAFAPFAAAHGVKFIDITRRGESFKLYESL
ncbi:MAG: MBL fold metallo-hydrolase [Mediterranea sp.]|jgi:L-ascorbate metabolism protein UlaG (beta-lactamase superfamily)|nr:MBL fold metallo-hydrolase [Mediterranea sp.]